MAHDHLALAGRRAGEQEQADVAADEDHEQQRGKVHGHRPGRDRGRGGRGQAERGARVGHDTRSQVLVRRGRGGSRGFGQHRDLGVRLLERDVRGHAPEEREARPLPRLHLLRGRIEPQGEPGFVDDREGEALRHHAHDRGVLGAHRHRPAHDVRIGRERRDPGGVAEHDHRRRIRALVGLHERAPEHGPRARQAEARGAHLRRHDHHARPVARAEVPSQGAVGSELLHGGQLAPPHRPVPGGAPLRVEGARVHDLDRDDAVALRQIEVRGEDLPEELERGRARHDGERERESAQHRESWIPHQHPETELEVEAGDARAEPLDQEDARHVERVESREQRGGPAPARGEAADVGLLEVPHQLLLATGRREPAEERGGPPGSGAHAWVPAAFEGSRGRVDTGAPEG